MTTLPASERVKSVTATRNTEYQASLQPVVCHLLDLEGLKDFYNQASSADEQIADSVSFDLPANSMVLKDAPYKTLLAIIKGNTLRDLYKRHKETLFNYNIRDFLGKARAINKNMINTAESTPDEFFYFNNGVSAVCSNFEVSKNKLTARKFQIINGAQTVGALHAADGSAEVEVLFRLTESNKARFNDQIIRFNNTQNTINSSDFRSNDKIQEWLELQFSQLKPRGPLPLLRYSRKRSYKRNKGATTIPIEELAKIQYSFLHEPTIIYEAPKQLWTFLNEGGRYEKAFGIDDEIVDAWPTDKWNLALLAIGFYLHIVDLSSIEIKEAPDNFYIKRLRYHLLAFAGLWIRGSREKVDVERAIKDKEVFSSLWDQFWPHARQTLIFSFEAARSDEVTLSAFARSEKRWDEMQRQFARLTKLKLGS